MKAEAFLSKTTIRTRARVRELSKGMVTQLHLVLVMAIDARVLVLDEPTLGLDILYRKQFYDAALRLPRAPADGRRGHAPGRRGAARPDRRALPRPRPHCLQPQYGRRRGEIHRGTGPSGRARSRARAASIAERQGIGHSVLDIQGAERQQLAAIGDFRTPSIADLFVAVINDGTAQGARS